MKKTILISAMVFLLILTSTCSVFADAMAYDVEPANYYVYVATPDGGLNMRHGPSTDYAKVMEGRIPDGVKLYITMVSGNWGYTSYDGYNGWVALKQTAATPPTPHPAPQITAEPTAAPTAEAVPSPAESISPQQTPDAATETQNAMSQQIILIAIFVLLIVIAALLIIVIINRR